MSDGELDLIVEVVSRSAGSIPETPTTEAERIIQANWDRAMDLHRERIVSGADIGDPYGDVLRDWLRERLKA